MNTSKNLEEYKEKVTPGKTLNLQNHLEGTNNLTVLEAQTTNLSIEVTLQRISKPS